METLPPLAPSPETAADDPSLPDLVRALKLASGGFSLFIASCDDLLWRDECVRRLTEKVPGSRIVSLSERTADPFESLPRDIATAAAIHIVRLELTTPADESHLTALRTLNLRRGQWKSLPCPVVLWVPEYLLGLLLRHAPDFADWRSGTFAFKAPEAFQVLSRIPQIEKDSHRWGLPLLNIPQFWSDAQARRERQQELMDRLPDLASGESEAATDPIEATWCWELASLAAMDNDSASAAFWQQAAETYPPFQQDPRHVANLRILLGMAWRLAGDLSRAREIFESLISTKEGYAEKVTQSPEDYHLLLSAQYMLADICRNLQDDKAAERNFAAAFVTAEALLARHSADVHVLRILYLALEGLQSLAVGRRDQAAADAFDAPMENIASTIFRLEPDNPQNGLLSARLLQKQGMKASGAGDFSVTITCFSRAADIFRNLSAREPANFSWKESLHICLYVIALHYLKMGDLKAAQTHCEEALALVAEAKAGAHENDFPRLHAHNLQWLLAAIAGQRGDKAEKAAHLKRAFDGLHTMKRCGVVLDEAATEMYNVLANYFLAPAAAT